LKNYSHLFFDLDHTLWDYERNSQATLAELYDKYGIKLKSDINQEDFVTEFTSVNDQLWDDYHSGKIDQAFIRRHRFVKIFKNLGYEFSFTAEISLEYINECPKKGFTLPGAIELLDHLHGKYEMLIITNGFEDIQHIKMSTTGLDKYFRHIIISGHTGFRKPEKEIFHHALEISGGEPSSSIMIGDSLESDIRGAKNVPMDQVYFNPNGFKHNEDITFEIRDLLEMKELGF
jgi:putative hydrolase of the HAD superfamily